MKVITLRNCGNFAGLFETESGAKAQAQKTLNEYHDMYAELDAEEREETEPLTARILEWKTERIDHRGLPSELGWDRPIARYSAENGYFTLETTEVGP